MTTEERAMEIERICKLLDDECHTIHNNYGKSIVQGCIALIRRMPYTGFAEKAFVSVSEAGLILGAHPRTVRRMIASGKLRAIRLIKDYRIELDSIVALSVVKGGK